MNRYDYRCARCGHTAALEMTREEFIAKPVTMPCPACGKAAFRRHISLGGLLIEDVKLKRDRKADKGFVSQSLPGRHTLGVDEFDSEGQPCIRDKAHAREVARMNGFVYDK